MSTITELKDTINTKTANLALLTIATAGIYPILWLYKNCKPMEKITKIRITDESFIIWLAVCVGLSSASAIIGQSMINALSVNSLNFNTISMMISCQRVMNGLSSILSIASLVLYIIWSFKAKKALQEYALNEHKINLKMNGFYTFFLTIYYINYCINNLPEVQRKQQILNNRNEIIKTE